MNIQFKTISTAVAYYTQLRTYWLSATELGNLSILLNAESIGQVMNYFEQYVKSKLSKEDAEFLFEYINKDEHTSEEQAREQAILFTKIEKWVQEAFRVNPLKRRSISDGLLIYPGLGKTRHISPAEGNKCYSLEHLQKIVGGYIQIIRLNDELMMIIDEDGKIKGHQPINQFATLLAHSYIAIDESDFIVGKAFICYSKCIK